jgi:hypothetical protein
MLIFVVPNETDMKDKKKALESAYKLLVMLGEISGEMSRGGEPATEKEINELYGYATEVYEYFENA